MVSSLVVATAAITVYTLIIFGYAAFWAFTIRRVLPVKLHRNHAMGVVIVALGWGLLDIVDYFVNASVWEVPWIFLTLFGLFIVMFYWIDSAVLSARRADPLLRDSAHWKSVRRPLWAAIVILVAFAIGSSVAGYPGYGGIFIIPFVLVGISGGLVLPIAARRSKDMVFNKHLRWFGVFSVLAVGWFFLSIAATAGTAMNPTTLLNSPLSVANYYAIDLVNIIGLTGAGYCLYKSARSLAPLNRLSTEEARTEASKP
jgi:hypothetical protein